MKPIFVMHAENTVFRVVPIEPPKKGYRLEFFDTEGSYAFEVSGKVLRNVVAAVDKYRAELAAQAAKAKEPEPVDAEFDDPGQDVNDVAHEDRGEP